MSNTNLTNHNSRFGSTLASSRSKLIANNQDIHNVMDIAHKTLSSAMATTLSGPTMKKGSISFIKSFVRTGV